MATWIINGRRGAGIEPEDRGLAYGDGLFETIALRGGVPRLLDQHLLRLAEGCRRLRLPVPAREVLLAELAQVAGNTRDGTCKVILTRGPAPRGYVPPPKPRVTRMVGFYPSADGARRGTGRDDLELAICRTPASLNPVLAGIKTLNRLDSVMARAELDDAGLAEGIMCDANGVVVGATQANIFMVARGRLQTPDLATGGVRGVMRGVVMACAAATGLAVEEQPITLDHLLAADEVFLTSALAGVRPASRLAGRALGARPVTERIIAALRLAGVSEEAA